MSFYRNGFAAEVYVAGVISRSKYIQQVRSLWSVPQLLKLAQASKWLQGNARRWMESRSFDAAIPADTLDAVFGIDYLVEVDGEIIAIDLTTNPENLRTKLDRLRESASVLPVIDKWCVLYWDQDYPISEQDILDIYLDEDRFQLMHLINVE